MLLISNQIYNQGPPGDHPAGPSLSVYHISSGAVELSRSYARPEYLCQVDGHSKTTQRGTCVPAQQNKAPDTSGKHRMPESRTSVAFLTPLKTSRESSEEPYYMGQEFWVCVQQSRDRTSRYDIFLFNVVRNSSFVRVFAIRASTSSVPSFSPSILTIRRKVHT